MNSKRESKLSHLNRIVWFSGMRLVLNDVEQIDENTNELTINLKMRKKQKQKKHTEKIDNR